MLGTSPLGFYQHNVIHDDQRLRGRVRAWNVTPGFPENLLWLLSHLSGQAYSCLVQPTVSTDWTCVPWASENGWAVHYAHVRLANAILVKWAAHIARPNVPVSWSHYNICYSYYGEVVCLPKLFSHQGGCICFHYMTTNLYAKGHIHRLPMWNKKI